MPLFRFHRGGLHESLQTTVVVKDLDDLKAMVNFAMREYIFMKDDDEIVIDIFPYPAPGNNFDDRIGWFTHMVTAQYKNITAHPVGYLSEPLT
jgi:hypothetical protein